METSIHVLNSKLIDSYVQAKLRNLEANKLELRIEVIDHLTTQLELINDIETLDEEELTVRLEAAYLGFGGDAEVCKIHDEMNRIWSMSGYNQLNKPPQLLITIMSLIAITGLVYTLNPSMESQAVMNNFFDGIHFINIIAVLVLRLRVGDAFFIKYHLMNTLAMIPICYSTEPYSVIWFILATMMTIVILPQLWHLTIKQFNRYTLQLS